MRASVDARVKSGRRVMYCVFKLEQAFGLQGTCSVQSMLILTQGKPVTYWACLSGYNSPILHNVCQGIPPLSP